MVYFQEMILSHILVVPVCQQVVNIVHFVVGKIALEKIHHRLLLHIVGNVIKLRLINLRYVMLVFRIGSSDVYPYSMYIIILLNRFLLYYPA
jgi:hypothetical protein